MPGPFLAVLFQAPSILALSFVDLVWGLLAAVVFFVGLLLIVIILVQDSKDGGLSGAFGGSGGGGSALMGAGMQKGLARMTSTLAIVFALCVLVMGIIGNSTLDRSIGEDVPVGEVLAPGAGDAADPGAGGAPDGAAPGGVGDAPPGEHPAGNE